MKKQGKRNSQRRDCLPRLREGGLAALLAMMDVANWLPEAENPDSAKQSQFSIAEYSANSRAGKELRERTVDRAGAKTKPICSRSFRFEGTTRNN